MYDQSMQTVRRRSVRPYRTVSGRSRHRRTRSQEQVRIVQLVVCIVLFLAVFIWKGAFPQKMIQVRSDLLTLISTNYDFREALSRLGGSLTKEGNVLSDFGDFCVEVFGTDAPEDSEPQQTAFIPPKPAGILATELQFLSKRTGTVEQTAHYANFSRFGIVLSEEEQVPPQPEETAGPEELPDIPAAGTVVVESDYSGEPLPDHGGVDIGGQTGDPIAAFAAGTVEYTGEDDSYGLYLQVDHGNGIKSFYAHCSKVVVVKGQTVAMGEKLAEIGSTGDSTGPHLHLEMKYNKMHLNPAYYVDFIL